MAIDRRDCAAVILAGGLSHRMGRRKEELTVGGETMLQRLARALSGFPEMMISANDPAAGQGLGRVVPDVFPGQGPLAGLHAALSATEKRAVLCVPCDLPYFSAEAAELLLAEFEEETDALVFRDGVGRVHPLCGIYSRRTAPRMRSMLERGERRVMELLRSVNCRFLTPGDALPDRVFLNMNTPEDYAAVVRAREDEER